MATSLHQLPDQLIFKIIKFASAPGNRIDVTYSHICQRWCRIIEDQDHLVHDAFLGSDIDESTGSGDTAGTKEESGADQQDNDSSGTKEEGVAQQDAKEEIGEGDEGENEELSASDEEGEEDDEGEEDAEDGEGEEDAEDDEGEEDAEDDEDDPDYNEDAEEEEDDEDEDEEISASDEEAEEPELGSSELA